MSQRALRGRRGVMLLAIGALALSAAALLAPHAPALYDGIGFPDEPYRYAQVLADDPVKTPPPTTATATLAMIAEANAQGIVLTTGESGPQFLAFVPKGAITTTESLTTLGIAATPRAPDLPAPADGPIAGDIYRLATTGAASWRQGSPGTISLRSPQGTPIIPTLEFRASGTTRWQPLATTRVGNDIWESPLADLGDYALILAAHPQTAKQGKSATIYLVAAGVALIALILIGVRLGLRRRRDPGT